MYIDYTLYIFFFTKDWKPNVNVIKSLERLL